MFLLKKSFLILFVSFILLNGCASRHVLDHIQKEQTYLPVSNESPADSSMANFIKPYKKMLDKEMNEVLNHSDTPMVKAKPESNLGNFVADLSFEYASKIDSLKPDFCLLNYGGLRTALPKGDITRGKIFELMPFENELVLLTISGKNTKLLFKYVAEKGGGDPISNARLVYDKTSKTMDIFINQLPFDTNKTYKVLTSDYLASGGDNMFFLSNPIKYQLLNMKLRDAIINHIKEMNAQGQIMKARTDGRIIINE